MTKLMIPEGYRSALSLMQTEEAIRDVKDSFQANLELALGLRRVSAPLFVIAGSGINDDLNGVERKAEFLLGSGAVAQGLNSLAKWKRMKLAEYGFKVGEGLYTDMNGIRLDDELDNLHSHYVDQWDWEKAISRKQRTAAFLEETVRRIYSAIQKTGKRVQAMHPGLRYDWPVDITFVHTEDLLAEYPSFTPRQREDAAAKKYGAVFIRGIGGKLTDGTIHDGRAPDYDDWTTAGEDGKKGLNGDIVMWYPLLQRSFELSSMGIRVDPESLVSQLKIRDAESRLEQKWHKRLVAGEYPLSIGGGIGQSRLCMFYLQKAHIGEVQASVWPEDMKKECETAGIRLL